MREAFSAELPAFSHLGWCIALDCKECDEHVKINVEWASKAVCGSRGNGKLKLSTLVVCRKRMMRARGHY